MTKQCPGCLNAMECIIGNFWVCKTCEPVSEVKAESKPQIRKREISPAVGYILVAAAPSCKTCFHKLKKISIHSCCPNRLCKEYNYPIQTCQPKKPSLPTQAPPAPGNYSLNADDVELDWSDMEKITEEMFPLDGIALAVDLQYQLDYRKELLYVLGGQGLHPEYIDLARGYDYLLDYHTPDDAELFEALIQYYKREKGLTL